MKIPSKEDKCITDVGTSVNTDNSNAITSSAKNKSDLAMVTHADTLSNKSTLSHTNDPVKHSLGVPITKDRRAESTVLNSRDGLNHKAFTTTGTELRTTAAEKAAVEPLKPLKISFDLRRVTSLAMEIQHECDVTYPQKLVNASKLSSDEYLHAESAVDLTDEELDSIKVDIDNIDEQPYIEGFPIWERLPWESVPLFTLFKTYRDMGYEKLDSGLPVRFNRSLNSVATVYEVDAEVVAAFSYLYLWNKRIKAFDNYMRLLEEQHRKQQQYFIENRQSIVGEALTTAALNALNDMPLPPKVALDVLKFGVELSRITAGLQKDKPSGFTDSKTPTVSINNTVSAPVGGSGGSSMSNKNNVLDNMDKNIKEEEVLVGVLNILQQSGAMNAAIDGEFTEVADESTATS